MKKNKYGNKWSICKQGHNHQSKGEALYCNELALQLKIGLIHDYEIQKSYKLSVNDKYICSHKVDFWVINIDDSTEIHEFKGYETSLWKLKKKMFEAIYPDIKYIVVKNK